MKQPGIFERGRHARRAPDRKVFTRIPHDKGSTQPPQTPMGAPRLDLTEMEAEILSLLAKQALSPVEIVAIDPDRYKRGSVYPVLKRLERDLLVVKVPCVERTSGRKPGRPKERLRITARGCTALGPRRIGTGAAVGALAGASLFGVFAGPVGALLGAVASRSLKGLVEAAQQAGSDESTVLKRQLVREVKRQVALLGEAVERHSVDEVNDITQELVELLSALQTSVIQLE